MNELDRLAEAGTERAKALRAQARQGGLHFEVYLPSDLADWILGLVERQIFNSPSEAAFIFLQEQRELEPYGDLREELLRRRIIASMNDPRPTRSMEEVFAELRQRINERTEPAVWQKIAAQSELGHPGATS